MVAVNKYIIIGIFVAIIIIGSIFIYDYNSRFKYSVVSQNGKYAYLGNSYNVTIVDIASNQIVGSINTTPYAFVSILINPSNNYAYILGSGGDSSNGIIYIVNTSGNKIVNKINLMILPNQIVLSADQKYAYVTISPYYNENYTLEIVNLTNNSIARLIKIPQLSSLVYVYYLAVDPTGKYLYLLTSPFLEGPLNSSYTGPVFRISVENSTVVDLNCSPTYPYVSSASVSPDGKILYVSDFYAGQGHYASASDSFNLSSSSCTLLKRTLGS
jgi:DNA-binding beta-propeller fold protein YncE